MTAMKSVENSWKRGIDKGKKTLTDVMNSIYQSRNTQRDHRPHPGRKWDSGITGFQIRR